MAECTEELPKHLMASYIWVYFKLKYTRYIFDGIFCPVGFVQVPFVRGSVYLVRVYFVQVSFIIVPYTSLCKLSVFYIICSKHIKS